MDFARAEAVINLIDGSTDTFGAVDLFLIEG